MTRNSRSARLTWRCFRCPLRRNRLLPDEETLTRAYENHKDSYATPEYRRIKAIELSPQSLGSQVTVTDDELRAAYEEHKATYQTPEKRSAEVISAPDEAKARALADKWRGGADWAAMQAAAQADGASGIVQDDATEVQFPDPDLAKAVFAAAVECGFRSCQGATGLVRGEGDKDHPAAVTTFDQAKDELRSKAVAAKAADLMYERANKLDQLLGNGTSLDNLPGDLGVVGLTGTLDAQGEYPGRRAGSDPRPDRTEVGHDRGGVPGAAG